MVVSEVAGQDAAEVSLVENEHVIQTLTPDRADEPLHERVLPWAVRRRENLLDPHALHAMPKWLTVDAVAVAKEVGRRGLVREGVDELLRGPDSGRVLGDVEVDDRRRWWVRTTRTKRTRRRAVGTVKKSIETRSRTWFARNARQV
jgi:hypothetical protein